MWTWCCGFLVKYLYRIKWPTQFCHNVIEWSGRVSAREMKSFVRDEICHESYRTFPQARSYHKEAMRSCTCYWQVTDGHPGNLFACYQPWFGIDMSGQSLTLSRPLLELNIYLKTYSFTAWDLITFYLCWCHFHLSVVWDIGRVRRNRLDVEQRYGLEVLVWRCGILSHIV